MTLNETNTKIVYANTNRQCAMWELPNEKCLSCQHWATWKHEIRHLV